MTYDQLQFKPKLISTETGYQSQRSCQFDS
uniref:Uncharacterized protein n=1 Tax=Rhizophora mucronata TaxID=61149 RepID=A0A2P2J1X5_RHIMU